MTTTGMRAGEVAAAAGVHVETLRFNERRGLLAAPQRTLGGHRLYSDGALLSLRVIKTAQRLGFTLTEVAELLDVGIHHHGHHDSGLHCLATAKLAEIGQKISDLRVVGNSLRKAIEAGCDDLAACADSPRCPLPFAHLTAADETHR